MFFVIPEREYSDSQVFTKQTESRSSFRRFRSSSVNNKEDKDISSHAPRSTFGSEVKQMFKKNKGKQAEEDAFGEFKDF